MLPTFIIIGPGRTGTTWMYELLLQHPEVCMAKNTKETLFFTQQYNKGINWYHQFFKHCDSIKAVGEIGNTYFYHPEVPSRISKMIPEVQIITCLRNPLERLKSAYLYRRRAGEANKDFLTTIRQQKDLILNNLYGQHLKRYLKHFDRQQFEILFYEDLKSAPEQFAKKLFRTIGVDENHIPEMVHEKVNPKTKTRIPGSAKLLRLTSDTLRRVHLYKLLNYLKRSSTLRTLLLREISHSDKLLTIPMETQKNLLEQFIPEIEMVEYYTGRDLTHWKEAGNDE